MSMVRKSSFVVIGGGIAGVSCAQQLSESSPEADITVIAASPLIKAVTNVRQLSRALTGFDVTEKEPSTLSEAYPNIAVIHSSVLKLDAEGQTVRLSDGSTVQYKRLCICSGATPKLIAPDNRHVIGIRDTQSVSHLTSALTGARRVLIIGNGGIATELVYAIDGCDVVWAIKDKAIGSAFFDSGAAHFFLPALSGAGNADSSHGNAEAGDGVVPDCEVFIASKRMKYRLEETPSSSSSQASSSHTSADSSCGMGSALGPDWSEPTGAFSKQARSPRRTGVVDVVYSCEVDEILEPNPELYVKEHSQSTVSTGMKVNDWPVFVRLTNGQLYGCDFVVSATGVLPQVKPFTDCAEFKVAEDGGLVVDSSMRTNIPHVYAAGDVCSAGWTPAAQWIQMRLWTQARQMGCYAALCMAEESGERAAMDFSFELFAHATKFFGYKVVLLGLFNGQGLPDDHELLVRSTEGVEYVKAVLHGGRMQGAVLIGETDLEETFENLILNQMDLSAYGESLLDPGVDIEDYFD
ncbi:pyridine nucleotide-disulfide oxidoreductase domain-containing protein 1-like [Sycon ciliatum]|uniref:pyridine nucleotide-disulfide oxidoreductase domain-containing protein 1-like n=1 Tax=Sycon ciliatum TaxID=27933 RepID=UPI0031F61050